MKLAEIATETGRAYQQPSCSIVDAVKQMSDLILITPCVECAALVDLPIITTNSNKIPAVP